MSKVVSTMDYRYREADAIPVSPSLDLGSSVEESLKIIDNKTKRTSGIGFVLQYPAANQTSAKYMMKTKKTITEVTVLTNAAPSAATTINIYKNSVVAATFTFTTASAVVDITDIACVPGDVIYAGIGAAVNGLTLLTIEVTVVDA